MDNHYDSDTNVTMLATKSFNHILEQIQTSCLNYQIQVSPFSAFISLKKSLIKDRSGKPRLPFKNKSASERIEHELDRKLTILGNEHSELIHDYTEACKTIETLQNLKQEVKIETASSEYVRGLESELCLLKEALKCRDDEILELQIANKNAKEASNKLN